MFMLVLWHIHLPVLMPAVHARHGASAAAGHAGPRLNFAFA
jgi:hypothetical protein